MVKNREVKNRGTNRDANRGENRGTNRGTNLRGVTSNFAGKGSIQASKEPEWNLFLTLTLRRERRIRWLKPWYKP